ncbi:Rha family transcriptional regulator [Salmonella enterica subsp. enterica]
MNTLSPIAGVKKPMMGSREIAKVTSKEHRNVVRDINAMLEQLGIHRSNLNDDDFKGFIIKRKEYQGRDVVDEIWLDENLSMTLVTGYDAKRRLALIEQWQAMKIELKQPRPASLLTLAPTPTPIQSAPTVQINDRYRPTSACRRRSNDESLSRRNRIFPTGSTNVSTAHRG